MPDTPVPLREALFDAFLAYAKGMQEILERVARREDQIPESLQSDTLASADRVVALLSQIPLVFEAREHDGA